MHALTAAADLDVSVRARRLACVLDPALLLAAPHALLLAQQLSRTVDLWVCPAFWRLLDASEFFGRRPARLRAWLALGNAHPPESVGAAVDAWSRWRGTRDLTALGLYWVGSHQTESFLPESGPRDLPARFEALLEAWLRGGAHAAGEVGPEAELAAPPTTVRALPGVQLEPQQPPPCVLPERETAQRHEGRLETAALSVALQAPVLTLAGGDTEPPGLVRQWADSGLATVPWRSLHPVSAAAEHERWWDATVACGAAATVAAAAGVGVRLALAQVVAPSGQFLPDPTTDWMEAFGIEDWGDGEAAPRPAREPPATAWWRGAQALWLAL